MKKLKGFMLVLLILCLTAVPLAAQGVDEESSEEALIEAARVMRESGRVQFNFKDLEIIKYVRFMSELLEENILVDPSVKGEVTIISPRAVTIDQARDIMISVLEMQGLSLQTYSGYSKLIPAKKGASTENIVRKGKMGPGFGDQDVVQIIPLDYVSANFVMGAVQKSLGKRINIVPLLSGGGVILSGSASEVQQAVGIIHAVDNPSSVKVSRTILVENASPELIAKHIAYLSKDKNSPLHGLFVTADPSSRKLILVGESTALSEAVSVVKDLDVPARAGDFHVYRLQNADATTVAEQLSELLGVAAKLEPDKKGALPNTVVADTATNSLIFAAPSYQYDNLVNIIQQLDTQPKQVLLRGVIAEVNLGKLKDAGFDWAGYGGSELGDDALFGGMAQMGSTGVPSTFLDYFQDLTTTEELETRDGETYKVTNTQTKGLLYASIRLLNQYDAVNVLSMPRLMCTDNMESSLQVGQVIPQLKQRNADVTNPSSVENSYEYKDTGIILKVTPHVRSGNLVALDIEQTIEDVLSTQTSDTPTTSKREITTSVMVRDGETIVLGGLITDSEKFLKNRVPGLSYIPLLGNLFTTTSRQKERVELVLLLTPEIIDTPEEATEVTHRVMESGRKDMTPEEVKLQMRFQKLYDESVKKQ